MRPPKSTAIEIISLRASFQPQSQFFENYSVTPLYLTTDAAKGLILESLNKKLKPLGMDIQGYDPCVEKFSGPPKPADILLCTDVLEHVEPEKTEEVLRHIRVSDPQCYYLIIDLLPAAKRLPDGRNAHINLNTAGWWLNALSDSFPFSLQYLLEKEKTKHHKRFQSKNLFSLAPKQFEHISRNEFIFCDSCVSRNQSEHKVILLKQPSFTKLSRLL